MQNTILKAREDRYVREWVPWFIGFLMLCIDYNLSIPLWTLVFDLGELAPFLSAGMGVSFLFQAHIAAKLLSIQDYTRFAVSVFIFGVIMCFIFLGHEAALEYELNDPLRALYADEMEAPNLHRHYIAIGLTVTLWSLAVFTDYLVCLQQLPTKEIRNELMLSAWQRRSAFWFKVISGVYERTMNKPIRLAEKIVNTRLEKLKETIDERTYEGEKLINEKQYRLEELDLLQKQAKARLEAKRNKKSLIKSLFSWKK